LQLQPGKKTALVPDEKEGGREKLRKVSVKGKSNQRGKKQRLEEKLGGQRGSEIGRPTDREGGQHTKGIIKNSRRENRPRKKPEKKDLTGERRLKPSKEGKGGGGAKRQKKDELKHGNKKGTEISWSPTQTEKKGGGKGKNR